MAIEVPSTISNSNSNSSTNGHKGSASHHDHESTAHCSSSSTRNALATLRHLYPPFGLFLFYILHDALQERMFRYEGFSFGFFMTLVEVVIMLVASLLPRLFRDGCGKGNNVADNNKLFLGSRLESSVLGRIGIVGLFLALAHGLGNTALRYSPYPLKVAFKSCKLVPTMALGACVTGRKHTALQYTAALVMGMGLAVLTAADVFTYNNNKLKLVRNLNVAIGDHGAGAGVNNDTGDLLTDWALGPLLGPTLLTISTFFDSVVPNLQEQLLQSARVKTSEMIFISNAVMCIVLVGYTTYSHEMMDAWNYCIRHKDATGVLIMQGVCAYMGLKCYLAIIRDHGGVVAVLLANGRKIATIIISFMLFSKPFNARHFVGLILVFVGVYLGYLSKRGMKKDKSSRKRSKVKKSKLNDSEPHEHKV